MSAKLIESMPSKIQRTVILPAQIEQFKDTLWPVNPTTCSGGDKIPVLLETRSVCKQAWISNVGVYTLCSIAIYMQSQYKPTCFHHIVLK